MADFDDELSGYIQARTASDQKEQQESAAANAAADALFGKSTDSGSSKTNGTANANTFTSAYPYPHPEGFIPTQDAPTFAFQSTTQLWHDASTGTYSYYDATSETYVPVEAPGHQQYQQSNSSAVGMYESPGYYIDPNTGYAVDPPLSLGNPYDANSTAPPESDATLRLCVLSSKILKVKGVIMMDAAGLSFGRDRPLSGQGNRVRMVEMEISRFHASIFLDQQEQHQHQEYRQQQHPQEQQHPQRHLQEQLENQMKDYTQIQLRDHESASFTIDAGTATNNEENGSMSESNSSTPTSTPRSIGFGGLELSESEVNVQRPEILNETATSTDGQEGSEKEDGELPDSPSAGARDENDQKQHITDTEHEEGEDTDQLHHDQHSHQHDYNNYQQHLQEYQQYYNEAMTPPIIIDTFQITDCGSTHGTFLNGERLSAPKMASQPFTLKHLDQLQLGSTVFEIHLHEEGRICGTCHVTDGNEIEVLDDKGRDGVVSGSVTGDASGKNSPSLAGDLKLTREQDRIEEMNRLRKKWAGPDRKPSTGTKRGGGGQGGGGGEYVDRAAKRRLYNPDHSVPVPSVVPVYASQQQGQGQHEVASGFHVPVAKSNKGHAMLSKMGWKAGMGLGAASQGVVEPVQLMVTDKKAGLGSGALRSQGAAAAATTGVGAKPYVETPAEVARRKARERYAQLK